jgi:F0F1-type ATP synthase assembly protein I
MHMSATAAANPLSLAAVARRRVSASRRGQDYFAAGLALGIALGLLLGTALGNAPIGLVLGIGLGVALGTKMQQGATI